jgi:hypothetical protein
MNLAPSASYATVFGVQAKLVEGRWRSRRPAPRGEKRPVDAARVIGYARFFPARDKVPGAELLPKRGLCQVSRKGSSQLHAGQTLPPRSFRAARPT